MPADRTTADAQTPWAQGRGTPSSGPSSSETSASSPDSPDSALAGLDALQSDGRRRPVSYTHLTLPTILLV